MLAGLALRRRQQARAKEIEASRHSGASDHESERVGGARRKRRKRECQHDPWAQELAKILMGVYYWLTEPTNIKSEYGNGLENTIWGKFCLNDKTILIGMMGYRYINYLIVQTYYVPDEYWQSLEVAHNGVFGDGYLTWEWTAKIRSYLYPAVFTLLYKAVDLLGMDSYATLAKLPRILQGLFYAVGDLYLYKLSSKLSSPLVGQWTLLCSCLSWFTFYCATRTLTNTAETTLVTIALYYYPWTKSAAMSSGTWKFLWVAAISVIVRPTAAIIWIPLCVSHIVTMRRRAWNTFVLYTITALVFGFISIRIDKAFYGEWTVVPLNFFNFNISKQISHLYGTHPWHWYVTQGLPFVLSTHTVLFILGWKKCKNRSLQMVLIWTVAVYSLLAHKEFRFVMPVLPMAMHVCGYYITVVHQQVVAREKLLLEDKTDLEPITEEQVEQQIKQVKAEEALTMKSNDADSGLTASEMSESVSDSEIIEKVQQRLVKKYRQSQPQQQILTPRRVVILLVIGNLPMMLYFSILHQRGALDVVKFIHSESLIKPDMSVLFLMPCHSTPYYSHVHTNITMRFLTCEPNLNGTEGYTDEAQRFYSDPIKWLKTEVVKGPNRHVYSHVVMFDSLETRVANFISKGKYLTCAKYFFSHLPGDDRKSKHIKVLCRKI